MSNKIFAYTKSAGLTPEIINKLLEAGYIPVPVKKLDCIKVIEPLPDGEGSAVFSAALEAIRDSATYADVKKVFAEKLTKKLAPKKGPTDTSTREDVGGQMGGCRVFEGDKQLGHSES